MDATVIEARFMQAVRDLIPAWESCVAEYVVQCGNTADEILKIAEEKHADLIIVGARPAWAIATHLVPGVAFRVIAGATCPVLTILG